LRDADDIRLPADAERRNTFGASLPAIAGTPGDGSERMIGCENRVWVLLFSWAQS